MRLLIAILFFITGNVLIAQDDTISEEDYNLAIQSYQEATDLFYAKDYRKALPLARQAAELNRGNSDYWFLLSNAHSVLRQLDSALITIKIADGLEPNQSDYLFHYGNVLFNQEKYIIASEKYSLVLKYQSTSEIPVNEGHVYFNRGNCWLNLKKYTEAKEDFDAAIEIGYQVAMVYHNRATTLVRLNKRKDACADYKKAIQLGSKISQRQFNKYCR